jgi:hypothetical protein
MGTTTRADRIATAQRLRAELKSHRRSDDDPQAEGPRGDCGRDVDDPRGCGMKDESECKTHCGPAPNDPALLGLAGTLASRKRQLKAARRDLLRR